MASPQLRTPMNAVIALSSLALEEGRLEPEIEEYIKGVRTHCSSHQRPHTTPQRPIQGPPETCGCVWQVGTASSALLWVLTQILEYSNLGDGGGSPRVVLSHTEFTLQQPLAELFDLCAPPDILRSPVRVRRDLFSVARCQCSCQHCPPP